MKPLFSIMLSVLISAFALQANVYHEQTSKVTHFDYSQFTYTYVEDGVEKTAHLTDEATSTSQIAALLKEVYVNADIPGIHYGYDFNGMQSRKLDYNEYGHKLSSQNDGYEWQRKSAGEFFPNPTLDGMTVMMVTINDTWRSTYANGTTPLEYLSKCYTSMRLMSAFTRVNSSTNPGYLVQFNNVSTNRFFFISKGKPRGSYTRPLYRLYEQISPVKGDNGHTTNDFIDEMRAGHPYLCYHDCSEIGTIGGASTPHWFTISNNGENFNLSNLTIFIPDRRFEPQHDPEGTRPDNEHKADVNGVPYFKDYGNSNDNDQSNWMTDIMPKVLVYTAYLDAEAVPSETDGYYDINLSWSTNLSNDISLDVPQHFYVYLIEGNNRLRLVSVVNQPTTEMSHTYTVEQTSEPQTFSYVITAHPINYDNDGQMLLDSNGEPLLTVSAESPVRTVTVPGRHSAFFIQSQEYRSRFEVNGTSRQYNVYKNKFSIRPNTDDDYESIGNSTEVYDVIRTDANGDRSLVANVRFIPVYGEDSYDYTVTYNTETQCESPVFDGEIPQTSGRINGYQNSTVTVIDRFYANTDDNTHSDRYIYSFEQNGENYSNVFTVPVYKTTNTVSGREHTHAEISADTDHSAKATPSNVVTFEANTDVTSNIVEYGVYRADYQLKKLTKIGKAERSSNTDTYSIYSVGEDGMINDFLGNVSVTPDEPDITVLDYNNKDYNLQSLYVPVITALYNGDYEKKNTYGCDFKTMYYPQLEAEVVYMEKTNQFAGPNGPQMGFRADIVLTPRIHAGSGMNPYYYRIWRVMNSSTSLDQETLLNAMDDVSGEGWGSHYEEIKAFFPVEYPYVVDIFVDDAMKNGGSKIVTYIARLYSTTLAADEAPTFIMGRRSFSGMDYFIAEDVLTVRFDDTIVTSCKETNASGQPIETFYIDMCGRVSRTPFSGVNVVMGVYSDGRRSVVKKVFD